MIQSLEIHHIALIDHLQISFHPGMQVLSGETGAGKSIVVDAVNLALGERADRNLIRSGCEKASVEAIFDVPSSEPVRRILEREGVEYDGVTVSVYREISVSGRNICRICGVILPVAVLRELSAWLMDIHGQHEHQFLMDPERHLSFLDRMGDRAHQTALEKTARDCEAFLAIHRQYARLRKEQTRKEQRIGQVEEALKELHEARLKAGEEENLAEECLRLRNSEKIVSVLRSARESLTLGDSEKSSLEKIRDAGAALSSLREMGQRMSALADRCESAYYELEEIGYELHSLIEDSDRDPERLEKAEARLDLIRRLERKYGATVAEVLEKQGELEAGYENLCSLDDRLSETAAEHKRLLGVYRASARELTGLRQALAESFERNMARELKDLGMEKTVFKVVFAQREGEKHPMPRSVGDDEVEFMISPNPGEPLKPLARIASGGELSRLMLAIKSLEADNSGVDCMVFDEIDTGISGRMAQVVAEKMVHIAGRRQVICVSHLSQIVAAADYQYLVAKEVREGRTYTGVRELEREERIRVLAGMIGGAEGSGENALDYASTLLEAIEHRKEASRKTDA